jgi:release factor glutamine methyltransferase
MARLLNIIQNLSQEHNIPTNELRNIFISAARMSPKDIYHCEYQQSHQKALEQAIYSIKNNIPIARLTNYRYFYDSYFYVSPYTFDPRSDTEALVELSIPYEPKIVLDIGTGTGCILISILKHLRRLNIHTLGIGYDTSEYALANAQYNAAHILHESETKPIFINDLESISHLIGKIDLIVSNPPYVRRIPDSSTRFDPPISLYYIKGIYPSIFNIASKFLKKNGMLVLEIPEYLCFPFMKESKYFMVKHIAQAGDVVFASFNFDSVTS